MQWTLAAGAAVRSSLSFAFDHTLFKESPKVGFPILQGMTDETMAQFTVVLPKGTNYTVVTSAPQTEITRIHEFETSDFCVWGFKATGLELDQTYALQFIDSKGEVKDQREFSALNLSARKVRLGIVSCAMDHLHRDDIWREFEKQKPDLALFIGDNVYCDRRALNEKVDIPDPQLIWDRYVATRQRVAFYFQKRLTPTLAIWDDHDFGGNNSLKSFPYVKETTDTFNAFFAQEAGPSLIAGPGIARKLSAFGGDLFMLDGRSFRSEPKVSGGSMFGDTQMAWIKSQLRPTGTLLLNGSVFFGGYGDFESHEGDFPSDFKNFLEVVRASGARAAFASGDVHFSEIMDIEPELLGYPTFELVSSSIHSLTFPGHHDRYKNPRRRDADSSHNFLIFEGEFLPSGIRGEAICWVPGYDMFRGLVKAE